MKNDGIQNLAANETTKTLKMKPPRIVQQILEPVVRH